MGGDENWLSRIHGILANASNKSHAELVNVFGGCCGTDHRHVEAIVKRQRLLSEK